MVLIDLILVPVIQQTATPVQLVIIVLKAKDFLDRVHLDSTVQAGSKKNDSFIKLRSFGKGQADRQTINIHLTQPLNRLNVPFIRTMILVMLLLLMTVTIAHPDISATKLELEH